MHRIEMKKLLIGLGIGLVGFVVFTVALWFGGRWYFARSVAVYDGEVHAPGLGQPVEVTFDAKGIPQIWAGTDADLYFTLGWVHASERLFQMELIRRVAAGELAEVFGEDAYAFDVRQRTIGFARKARAEAAAFDGPVRGRYERYVEGINAYVAQARLLPPEFVLLRFRPRPWTVEDCLAVALYQTWFSHALMDHDETYARLIERLGPEAARLLGRRQDWSPPTVPEGARPGPLGDAPFPLRMSEASNAWVVAPGKSASGAALHAADPHLAVDQVPVLWYAAGLHSDEGTHVVGVTVPGMPFVSMGHNGTASYSFTVASVDIVDYFDETLHPDDTLRVRVPGGWAPLGVTHERIAVKGAAQPRRVPVYTTPRGVVVRNDSAGVVSMHWAGFDVPIIELVAGGAALERAQDFDQFRRAVTRLGGLDVNWIYADRHGTIGYQLGSPVPVRTYADTYARHDAADSTAVWRGYRPLDETPHAVDPARGWLASCNNQIVGDDWPYDLPGFYDPYRIVRAEALLSSKDVFTRADVAAFQRDVVSVVALRWKDLAADGADRMGRVDVAAGLRAWDASMAPGDTLAAVFAFWWYALPRALFEDELGDAWRDGYFLQEPLLSDARGHDTRGQAPLGTAAFDTSAFIDDRRTPAVETAADVSARAMTQALDQARGRTFGDVSTLTVAHPLSRVPLVDAWLGLNRGPVPVGGDMGTLNANPFRYRDGADGVTMSVGPSMRFVMDWADADAFTLEVAFGQSGNPFSPYYDAFFTDDFFAASRRGEGWVVPFTKDAVYARRVGLLRLRPGGA